MHCKQKNLVPKKGWIHSFKIEGHVLNQLSVHGDIIAARGNFNAC